MAERVIIQSPVIHSVDDISTVKVTFTDISARLQGQELWGTLAQAVTNDCTQIKRLDLGLVQGVPTYRTMRHYFADEREDATANDWQVIYSGWDVAQAIYHYNQLS